LGGDASQAANNFLAGRLWAVIVGEAKAPAREWVRGEAAGGAGRLTGADPGDHHLAGSFRRPSLS
jgi:hypothetical protein